MYSFEYRIRYERTDSIIISIFNLHPSPIYNPYNFEPKYQVLKRDEKPSLLDYYDSYYFGYTRSNEYVSKDDLFIDFYSYIPDVVPYLTVEFHFFHVIQPVKEPIVFDFSDMLRSSFDYNRYLGIF